MSCSNIWTSPDGLITKIIKKQGAWGLKPLEQCECTVNITNCNTDIHNYNENVFVIGNTCSKFERHLDNCLQFMHKGEIADVTFNLEKPITFTIELKDFVSKGFIYKWNADEKFKLAEKHKEAGVKLFKDNVTEAAHRFSKAFKIIASIPIDVENPPIKVDGIEVKKIKTFKANIHNNLASCYLKKKDFENVIYLCNKVLEVNNENVKALYKVGFAYYKIGEYEKAEEALKKLLQIEPDNKAAKEILKPVKAQLNVVNAEFNAMVKKMFPSF